MMILIDIMRVGFFSKHKLVMLANAIGIPLLVVYIVSMFLVPAFRSSFDLVYLQQVWVRWQGVNVGVLAFASSLLAFNIARYNAAEQRDRNLAAAKAFLPAALDELSAYLEDSTKFYKCAWQLSAPNSGSCNEPLLPKEYRLVFSDCIRNADPETGDYLARILRSLQIHSARLHGCAKQIHDIQSSNPSRINILDNLVLLGQIQGWINRLFPFARGEGKLDTSLLTWEEIKTAFVVAGLNPERYTLPGGLSLESYTTRRIART